MSPGLPARLTPPGLGAAAAARGEDGRGASQAAGPEAAKPRGRFGSRVYLSAAFTVTSGVLAAWSRHEADRAYDRYLHAASQQRQRDYFRRAKRYDRVTGVALAAMEAGLVFTTCLVFF